MPKKEKEEKDIFGDDLFSEENVPESNWFKFEKPGDRIMGILVETTDRPAKDVFPASRVFKLKQKDGTISNVSIPLHKDYVIGRANAAKMGDMLGFEFKKEIEPSKKGFAPAKSLEVYVKHIAPQEDITEQDVPFD